MNMTKYVSASLALATTALLMTTTAHAEDPETVVSGNRNADVPVAYVKYADLNLKTDQGVADLRKRVRRVATNMCVERGNMSLEMRVIGWECRDVAVKSAEPQIARAADRARNGELAMAEPISINGTN